MRDATGRTNEAARVATWAAAAILLGGAAGAVLAIVITGWGDIVAARESSGSWRFALERAGLVRWAGAGAVVGFVAVMTFVSWRTVVGGLAGTVIGVTAGALIGDAATPDDFGAPIDWGFLVGAIVGVIVGPILGISLGLAWHLRHFRRIRGTASPG